jgi:retinol dehydrogenase 14
MADNLDMTGRNAFVTGGTGGIGKATAVGLAGLGARVGITGRDRIRAEAAAADVRAASGNPAVDVFTADMSSQTQVRRLAGEVLDAYPRLDVLVNNVGGFWAHRHVTADGLEHTFAVNHLAPFLLTNLLLDRLKASAPARVVTVSSGTHATGRIDFDNLQGSATYSGQRAYNAAKLANVMFTYELARRLDGTGVTATVLHPGVVRTNFGAEDQAAFIKVMLPLVRLFMKTPTAGAATTIYLASSAQVEGVTGRYFADRKPKTSTKASYDTAAAARLWTVSADLVGLTAVPPPAAPREPPSSFLAGRPPPAPMCPPPEAHGPSGEARHPGPGADQTVLPGSLQRTGVGPPLVSVAQAASDQPGVPPSHLDRCSPIDTRRTT